MRVTGAEELYGCFHEFFAGELGAREGVEDVGAVLGEEGFALLDAFYVGVFELDPPVRLEFAEGWLGWFLVKFKGVSCFFCRKITYTWFGGMAIGTVDMVEVVPCLCQTRDMGLEVVRR